jgi:hypothetical protein
MSEQGSRIRNHLLTIRENASRIVSQDESWHKPIQASANTLSGIDQRIMHQIIAAIRGHSDWTMREVQADPDAFLRELDACIIMAEGLE